MNAKRTLQNRIRGWFPQEPQFPNKPMKIKLETNPLKLKQIKGKLTINVAQFLAVILAASMILSGLYLNSISTTKTSYQLPISSTTYYTPVEIEDNSYNCTIHLSVPPPITGMGIGTANNVNPLFVYVNDPNNITSGVYVITLRYVSYNATTNTYMPQETNNTGTFTPSQPNQNKPLPIIGAVNLKPTFQQGPANTQPIVSGVVFTLYCNASNAGASSFTITTPIDDSQSGYIVSYPYRNQANILLTVGIISLIAALGISYANLRKKSPNSLYNVLRSKNNERKEKP